MKKKPIIYLKILVRLCVLFSPRNNISGIFYIVWMNSCGQYSEYMATYFLELLEQK